MKKSVEQFETIYHYIFPEKLHSQMKLLTFQEHEAIVTVGDTIQGFYFLLNGAYYVTSPESNGKELLLRRCTAPSILGDIEVFQACSVQSHCVAVERCTFLFVPLVQYENHLKFDAAFAEILLKELAFKLRTCTTLSRVNALSSVTVKLAAYLCTIQASNPQDDYLLVQNMQDVADLIGTTNRHVNRIFQKWTEAQIIERAGHSIKIVDFKKLEALAENIRYA